MLLQEYTNDALMQRVIRKLESAGLRLLDHGVGAHAAVFSTRSGEVVKAFERDECYLRFIALIQQHQNNPHFPRVRKVGRFTVPDLRGAYVLKLERLQPIPVTEFLADVGLHCFLNLEGRPLPVALWKKCSRPGFILDAAKQWQHDHPQFAEALDLVLSEKRNCDMDLHARNFMKRGDTWVITDPYIA